MTAIEVGPRDTFAVIKLDGTMTAGEQLPVTFKVTMVSGSTVDVYFEVRVLGRFVRDDL